MFRKLKSGLASILAAGMLAGTSMAAEPVKVLSSAGKEESIFHFPVEFNGVVDSGFSSVNVLNKNFKDSSDSLNSFEITYGLKLDSSLSDVETRFIPSLNNTKTRVYMLLPNGLTLSKSHLSQEAFSISSYLSSGKVSLKHFGTIPLEESLKDQITLEAGEWGVKKVLDQIYPGLGDKSFSFARKHNESERRKLEERLRTVGEDYDPVKIPIYPRKEVSWAHEIKRSLQFYFDTGASYGDPSEDAIVYFWLDAVYDTKDASGNITSSGPGPILLDLNLGKFRDPTRIKSSDVLKNCEDLYSWKNGVLTVNKRLKLSNSKRLPNNPGWEIFPPEVLDSNYIDPNNDVPEMIICSDTSISVTNGLRKNGKLIRRFGNSHVAYSPFGEFYIFADKKFVDQASEIRVNWNLNKTFDNPRLWRNIRYDEEKEEHSYGEYNSSTKINFVKSRYDGIYVVPFEFKFGEVPLLFDSFNSAIRHHDVVISYEKDHGFVGGRWRESLPYSFEAHKLPGHPYYDEFQHLSGLKKNK